MFDKRCRTAVERGLRPVGSGLDRSGITPNQLTASGLVISAGAAVAIGSGRLALGALLLALSAVPDLLDGAVAKASGKASPRGAFFDSVADRVSDNLVLGGLAWYLASSSGAHAAVLPLAVLGVSSLVSYERARAESLGFTARGGLMERAERMMAIGVSLLFSSLMFGVLWIMLVLTSVTAVHRFVMVWRQASTTAPVAGGANRWRGWRPGTEFGSRAEGSRGGSPRPRWRGRPAQARPATWRRTRTRP